MGRTILSATREYNPSPLHTLEKETREKCAVDLRVDGMFANVLKGCLIKCYEYTAFCERFLPEGRPFFVASTLRGICEDFIALRYLQIRKSPEDRDQLLANKMKSLIFDAVDKQGKFFKSRRSFQPIFIGKPKKPIPKASLPPIKNMAMDIDLIDLYDFMYAVTSDVVHFNPRIILRNAWGKNKDEFKHSVSNYDAYYADFCRTYSLYFFCAFAKAFTAELAFSSEYMNRVSELRYELDDKLRWPEAVTFEEMNIKGPTEFQRILLKIFNRPLPRDEVI